MAYQHNKYSLDTCLKICASLELMNLRPVCISSIYRPTTTLCYLFSLPCTACNNARNCVDLIIVILSCNYIIYKKNCFYSPERYSVTAIRASAKLRLRMQVFNINQAINRRRV